MFSFVNNKIWFCQDPVDFRKQIDGLVMLISAQLKQDPTSGQIYIFRSKRKDRIKLLLWERNGFWLLYKRLEKGGFIFPNHEDEEVEMTAEKLNWLLSGLDITTLKALPSVESKYFF
jgi:transposase